MCREGAINGLTQFTLDARDVEAERASGHRQLKFVVFASPRATAHGANGVSVIPDRSRQYRDGLRPVTAAVPGELHFSPAFWNVRTLRQLGLGCGSDSSSNEG